MYTMYVHYVCTLCMYTMYVHYVCTLCMYTMYVHYVCTLWCDGAEGTDGVPMILNGADGTRGTVPVLPILMVLTPPMTPPIPYLGISRLLHTRQRSRLEVSDWGLTRALTAAIDHSFGCGLTALQS
jgi:hypothetical protein